MYNIDGIKFLTRELSKGRINLEEFYDTLTEWRRQYSQTAKEIPGFEGTLEALDELTIIK